MHVHSRQGLEETPTTKGILNVLIQSQTPCPLGHEVTGSVVKFQLTRGSAHTYENTSLMMFMQNYLKS